MRVKTMQDGELTISLYLTGLKHVSKMQRYIVRYSVQIIARLHWNLTDYVKILRLDPAYLSRAYVGFRPAAALKKYLRTHAQFRRVPSELMA